MTFIDSFFSDQSFKDALIRGSSDDSLDAALTNNLYIFLGSLHAALNDKREEVLHLRPELILPKTTAYLSQINDLLTQIMVSK